MNDQPLGIFDSGVGGLSILREIRTLLPHEDLHYFADQAHVPYGARSLEEVRGYSEGITSFLLRQGAKLIVVACNTASAASLYHLRNLFPDLLFVGMEPAVKPAVESTLNGVVGVLATPATFQGELFASVVERFAEGVTVLPQTIPDLVERIEAGEIDTPETRKILSRAIQPLLDSGVDTLVLGCTHYPFIIPILQELVSESVKVINPSPAIARQTLRLLPGNNLLASKNKAGDVVCYTSADPKSLTTMLPLVDLASAEVIPVKWLGDSITPVN
ncbi:MAG: glutamate racemase [Anaerolineales bacterium]|nr:glutamate racemase [Anaerolineales bacterium]